MKKVLLEMKNITKSYGEGNSIFYALKDASLQIVDGDYVAIMGPSGSGKSTLLHMMGLLDEPTKGEIYVDGKHVTSMTEKERANVRNKKIGFVFQTFNLIQTLTALENVELPRIIHGAPKEERIKKAQQTLERLGMGHKFNNQPNAMSGGERQRTAIARALVNDPEIILADEPTGNLDSKNGEEVMGILKKLHNEGKTIVIITHDPSIAKKMKRTIRIKDGKIVGG